MSSSSTGADRPGPTAADLDLVADRLRRAQQTRVPCAPVRDVVGASDVDLAYAVQQRLTSARVADGARIVGRKIGLTSPAVQAQLGVDRPDFGVLFDDMQVECGGVVAPDRLIQPRVEAEVAFVLGSDLEHGPLDRDQVRTSVDFAVASLEIVDSRVVDWDITFGDTVADNASSGLFVLGHDRRLLDEFSPVDVQMSMSINGVPVSTGSGAACLGDPLEALRWLAVTARDLGQPLRAGQVVLSGALGPMREVVARDAVSATISGLGQVDVAFAGPRPTDDAEGRNR
jgi:2-keto-4-pentenoate hydratase